MQLSVRDGLKVVDEGAKGLVPSGCSYSRHSKQALFNKNPAGGSGSDNYELACIAEAAKARGAPSTYDASADASATAACRMELMGRDIRCAEGFYNGWNKFYASEAECTALCLAEPRCRFAALNELRGTCSRYDDSAGNCSEVKAGAGFRLYRKPAALHAAPCFSSEPSAPPPPSINICQPGGHVVLVHGERPDGLLEHMYAPIRRTIASAVNAVAGVNGCQLHVFFGHDWRDAWSVALGLAGVPSGPGLSREDLLCYSARYPDLQSAFGNDTEALRHHWKAHGMLEGRDPRCAPPAPQQQQQGLVFIWVGIQDEDYFFANGATLAEQGYTIVYYQTEPLGHGTIRPGYAATLDAPGRDLEAHLDLGLISQTSWIQILRDATWLSEIWDYSRLNVKLIRDGLGPGGSPAGHAKRVRYVPPGYVSDFGVTAPLTTTSSPRLLFMGKLKWRERSVTQMEVVEGYP